MKNLTENEVLELGYELAKEYQHDHYTTRRYVNGPLEIEFTYDRLLGGELETVDLTITDDIVAIEISKTHLKQLTKILSDK